MSSEFLITTDKQLWLLECPDWAVPFYATGGTVDGKPHWALLMAGSAPIGIRKQAGELVRAHSITGDPAIQIVPDEWWKEVAHPVYGTSPAYHERYEGKNPKAKTINFNKLMCSEEEEVSDEDFVKAAWRRSQIADLATFKAVWIAITQEIPRWMVGDLKPINFGWGELHAFPYRANWKQIVLSRFPNALSRLRKKDMRKSAEETELPALLRNVVNCAVEKKGHLTSGFSWTLEMSPTDEWFTYVRKVEDDRIKITTRNGYAASWGSLITRLFPSILRVFYRFVAQTAIPAGAISSGDTPGGSFLVPYIPSRGCHPVRVDVCDTNPVTPTAGELTDDRGRRLAVAKPNKNVSALPILRFRRADVRDSGGIISKSGWESGSSDGLLVLRPSGSEGPGENMLVEGHGGGGDGVGGIETPPILDGAPASQ